MDPDARSLFVEEFAHAMEEGGTARMAGRIFAFLLTDDRPYRSLQELARELGASKASISTNTRVLIVLRMIRRVPVPGSRMEHYGLEPGGVASALHPAAEFARRFSALAGRGQELFAGTVTPGLAALRELENVYARLADAIEELVTEKAAL
jgi:hypothetical protein